MRKCLAYLVFMGLALAGRAQQVRPATSGKIYHEIGALRHLVNVLYIAAHPDDENTRLLAWLVNNKNINTAYMSLTRGDGGQNILGSEQGEALGLIRTHELMEARKIDGASQFFSRAIDFGFSKNYQETFKHWNEDSLVSDVVWVMRKFRPDVVICRFPPDTNAGHGHHAASAVIAARAFKLAGDPSQYANQLSYYAAWQPKRLLQNTYRFGNRNTTSEDQFKLKVGEYIPNLGMGSGELAGLSRSVHKSQGAGTPSVPGTQIEYFKYLDGENLTKSLFDGIDITWGRVNRADIGEDIKNIEDSYDFMHPDASIPALLAVRAKIAQVTDDYWRKEKLAETDKIILDCSGLLAELYTRQPQAVRGATLPFTLHLVARSATTVMVDGITWMAGNAPTMLPITKTTFDGAKPAADALLTRMPSDTLLTFENQLTVPANEPYTQPYWLQMPHDNPAFYTIPNDTLRGLPETPDNLVSVLHLHIGETPFDINIPWSYKKLDPVKGDVVEQIRIEPDATVEFTNSLLVTGADGSVDATVRVKANKNVGPADLVLKTDDGIVVADLQQLSFATGADTLIPVHVPKTFFDKQGKKDISFTLLLSAAGNNGPEICNLTQHIIQYNHIPTLQYFTPASAKVLRKDWKCSARHVGYIKGAGDYIPDFLRETGITVDMLKEDDLTDAAKLKKYDAIITGIRAVNVEKRMAQWLPTLFRYVQNGGTLVMQYNTLQDLSTTKIGPYPFTLANLRVTEEDAAVVFTDPACRLLNYPNKITATDFDGWVQERGLYFASKWDEHYKAVFSMHDTGEQPLDGSTLYAKYGKGAYIYTCLGFSRQVPAGNKGAIRLLMNMISAGK